MQSVQLSIHNKEENRLTHAFPMYVVIHKLPCTRFELTLSIPFTMMITIMLSMPTELFLCICDVNIMFQPILCSAVLKCVVCEYEKSPFFSIKKELSQEY